MYGTVRSVFRDCVVDLVELVVFSVLVNLIILVDLINHAVLFNLVELADIHIFMLDSNSH